MTEAQATATVSIGRNVAGEPMEDIAWQTFIFATREAVADVGGYRYFDGVGDGSSEDWGTEESYTIVFGLTGAETIHAALTDSALPAKLRELADHYGQDAVALTVGATVLLYADGRTE